MHYLKRGAAPRPIAPPVRRLRPPLLMLMQTEEPQVKSSQTRSRKKYLLQLPWRSEAAPICWEPSQSCSSEHGSFHPGFQYLSQMEKAAKDMMSGVKLGPASSRGHLEVYQRQPHQEG